MKKESYQNLPLDAQEAFQQELENHPKIANKVHLYDGNSVIDTTETSAILDAGETIAIINAKSGQLTDLNTVIGCEITEDAELIAIKQLPIPGYPNSTHTIITIISENEEESITMNQQNGESKSMALPAVKPDYAFIFEQLTHHITHDFEDAATTPSGIIPPAGANWGKQTFNYPHKANLSSPTDNGNPDQTVFSSRTLTFYVYDANGNPAQNEYVVFCVMKGQVITQYNGTTLVQNNNTGRGYAAASFNIGITEESANMSFVSASPTVTTSSPVTDSDSYEMSVLAISHGGRGATKFIVSHSKSLPNEGWAVKNNDQAYWMYYNDNQQHPDAGWNTITDTVSNWSNWQGKVFGKDAQPSHVFDLPPQALNGLNNETIATWVVEKSNPEISFRINRDDLYYAFIYTANKPHLYALPQRGCIDVKVNLKSIMQPNI